VKIRIDSVVAIRMRQMADSIEKNPLPDVNADPYVSKPWTFRVGGKTYGIDSKGIHLGDITIPTAVLAFLSTPQGNIDQARANQAYMAMRADMLRAAARRRRWTISARPCARSGRARRKSTRSSSNSSNSSRPTAAGAAVKLVDTDDTVLIVTGIDVPAEMNDRPLAYRLKAEIDRRGDGKAFRVGLVVSDAWFAQNRIFHLCPVVAVGGRR